MNELLEDVKVIEEYGKQELLKATDAAMILNIRKSMRYLMMQRGEIPNVQLGGSVRVKLEDLERFPAMLRFEWRSKVGYMWWSG